jgi:uncharacterized membrane protein
MDWQQIVQQLESLAPQVWSIYVKQIYAYAYMDVLVGIPIGIILVILGVYLINKVKKHEWDIYTDSEKFMSYLGCCFLLVSGVVIVIWNSVDGFLFFYNPQFYAVDLILKYLHP